MLPCFVTEIRSDSIPVKVVAINDYANWLTKQDAVAQNWLSSIQFKNQPGNISLIADASGKLQYVLCCVLDKNQFWGVGALSTALPEGYYHLELDNNYYANFAIAWGLGAYQFSRYKKSGKAPARLVLPKSADAHYINNMVESIYLVRDLINTPTDHMGPSELADAAALLAKQHKAKLHQIIGDNLLKENYASIHTVGRASDDAPRLLDLRWGNSKHPKVTLVGKGVCFDTGGLDIKPSSGMLLMKKDMGGAAHVLGLARMIMQANLPIQLRVLIPAVENAISGNAYRPGDIIKSRKGLTVEIGNTDAEGRVVLADALTEAVSEKPELLIDIATLTGAARVALGTDLPAMFTNRDELAASITKHGEQQLDPVWRLPLFAAYRESLNSQIADINNNSSDSYAGAITAALFLKEFVPDDIPWVHFDLMAWNVKPKAGRPQGGEAMALRALFSYLAARFQ
ncbi:MAG: leucyl aminopeptidase family protein [Gammaproteobacteria bacterium]|nr:leucyl aminopeptidase family protein [Gammaproteobacteria bacterium]